MFSLIIPMYNEEEILPQTLQTLSDYMQAHFTDYEILFADDGSTDRSRAIVETCNLPHVRVVGYAKNRGKGCAVRTGMLAAKGSIRLFTDCDLAYGTESIGRLYEQFRTSDCDVIIGSRNIAADGYEGYTLLRKVASKAYIRMLCLAGGFNLSDSQCGFKAFSAKAAEAVFAKCETDNFAFDFEAILLANRLGFKVGEIPVKVINHRASKVHVLSDSLKMLAELRRIKKRIPKKQEKQI